MKNNLKQETIRLTNQMRAIAVVTFHELLREKILWSAFVFGLLLVGLSVAVSQLSFAENIMIATNFGLTSISIVGGLIAIIMGSSLIAKEVQNRTLYLTLTKSIWRWQFVVGRFSGLIAVITLNMVVMILVLLIIIKLMGGTVTGLFFKSLVLQITELGLLAAIATIFSALSSTALAAIISSGIWVIGHAIGDLRLVTSKFEPVALRPVLQIVTNILPDLGRFDIKAQVAHQIPVGVGYTLMTIFYGWAFALFALSIACLVFTRRDV